MLAEIMSSKVQGETMPQKNVVESGDGGRSPLAIVLVYPQKAVFVPPLPTCTQ